MSITKGTLVEFSFMKLGMAGSDTTTSGHNDQLALLELELMIMSAPKLGVKWNPASSDSGLPSPNEESGVTSDQTGPVTDMLAYNIALLFGQEDKIIIWKRKHDSALLNLTTREKTNNSPTVISSGSFYDLSKQVIKNTETIISINESLNRLNNLVMANSGTISYLNTQVSQLTSRVSSLESEVATMKTNIQDNEVLSKINESNINDIYNIIDSIANVTTGENGATNLYVGQNTHNDGTPYNAAIWAGSGYSSYDFGSDQNLAVGSDGSINFITDNNVSAGSFSGDQLTLPKAPIIEGQNLGDIIEDMQSRIYSLEQS